jgi:hypothetical protein
MGAGASTKQREPLQQLQSVLEASDFPVETDEALAQAALSNFLELVQAAGWGTMPAVRAKLQQMDISSDSLAALKIPTTEDSPMLNQNVPRAGEKLVELQRFLKRHMLAEKNWFLDAHFPPNSDSMRLRGEEDRIVPWKRIRYIYNNLQVFPDNGISPDSVVQSAHLGNCYFIAALSVLAERPAFLRRLFKMDVDDGYPEDGRFVLHIHHCGQWREISVDDFVAITASDTSVRLYFGKNKVGFWLPLLEKAYAKIYGSYGAIGGGDIAEAMRDLTGSPVISHRIDHGEGEMLVKTGALWNDMVERMRHGHLMACGWCGNSDEVKKYAQQKQKRFGEAKHIASMITPNHAYSILNCLEKNGKKMVEIRNPWGKMVDDDRETTTVTEGEVGRAWVPFEVWVNLFNSIYICILHHSELLKKNPKCLVSPSLVTVQGRWTGEAAAGCSQNHGWRDNPQYCICAKHAGKVYITLSQPDKRQERKKTKDTLAFEKLNYNQVGVEIVSMEAGVGSPELVTGKYKCLKKTSFWNKRDVSLELQITDALVNTDIVLVPSTYYPGQEGAFTLSAEWDEDIRGVSQFAGLKGSLTLTRRSFGNSGAVPMDLDSPPGDTFGKGSDAFNFSYVFNNAWNTQTSGGAPHNSRFHLNPQYVLEVNQETKVVLFVRQLVDTGASGKSQRKHKTIGIGVHAYSCVECLDSSATTEVLCFGNHPIGDPVLSKSLEVSKRMVVQKSQNPILIVPCVEKGGKSKFRLEFLSNRPISIRAASKTPSEAQVDLIKIEREEKKKLCEEEKTGQHGNKAGRKVPQKGVVHKPKAGKGHKSGVACGGGFSKAREGMSAVSDLYGNLE